MKEAVRKERDGDKGRIVMVVDDDDMIRRLVRTVLEADEFEVVEARNGSTALDMATTAHPAVVVLDIMMPGIDGVEVCRRLDHEKVKVVDRSQAVLYAVRKGLVEL